MAFAVVGTRTFNDYELLKETLDKYVIKKIISGGAKGADKLAEKYAKDNNIDIVIFLPDWAKYGKRAGPLRNILIVNECDTLIAFWDGESLGTKSSIDIAKDNNKKLIIIDTKKHIEH